MHADANPTESQDEELQAKHVAGLPADSRHQLIQLFRVSSCATLAAAAAVLPGDICTIMLWGS